MHCEREREKVRGKILGNRFERTTKGCYNSKVPHGSSVSAVLLRGIPPSESAQCTAKLAVSRRTGSGQVAQVVERSPEKAGVGGSTPSLATIFQRTYVDTPKRLQPRFSPGFWQFASIYCGTTRLQDG